MDSETLTQQEQDTPTEPAELSVETVMTEEEPERNFNFGEYLAQEYGYAAPKYGDIRMGIVVGENEHGLILDIGFKRDGIVPYEDLERLDEEARAEIRVGAEVPVFVVRPEDKDGHPILSIYQARMHKDWVRAEQMMQADELYEGEVAGYNKGGLIVKFGKLRGFVPISQITDMPRRMREDQRRKRLEAMVGKRIGLKIIEVDRPRRRLIFSQRKAQREWQELQRKRVMAGLVPGEVRRGKVTSITDFGVFIDLGGADGLIHVSELSWGRVEDPHQLLKVGDEIDVYVLEVDEKQKRIALSLKKLQPDPWTLVSERYREGQLVEGRVTRVLDFGAFIELDLGVEGLLHANEMIGTPELSPRDLVHPGDRLPVKIIRIDDRRRRLALSARQVRKGEWERWVAEQQRAQAMAERVPPKEHPSASEPAALAGEDYSEEAAAEIAEEMVEESTVLNE
ncbi:MAG: S1 RNA-binding domain-containing protein [Anaerolineae bacterium]|nr:S1 RNA-binding domain-containing protein [Anaerolineae bacterium]